MPTKKVRRHLYTHLKEKVFAAFEQLWMLNRMLKVVQK